jgi:hypothetical protein
MRARTTPEAAEAVITEELAKVLAAQGLLAR